MTIFVPFGTASAPFYTVTLSYATDILQAEDGTEQRICLRLVPKREESFLARTIAASSTGWGDGLIYGDQNTPLTVPEWPHGTFLAQPATAGSNVTLSMVSTADRDFEVGGIAVLWTDEGHTEQVSITAVAPTSITVSSLANNWGTGTFVLPAHTGSVTGDLESQRLSANIADLPIAFHMEHGEDPDVAKPATAEVFDVVPYLRQDVRHSFVRMIERLESITYTTADYELGLSPIGSRPFKVWLGNRASVTALIQWFYGVKGRLRTFYLPTYQEDLKVVSGLGTASVTIQRCGYTTSMFPQASRKALAAVEPNGTITKLTVTAAVDNGVAAGTETLTLDGTCPTGTTLLCYLLYGRLESDALAIVWRHSGFADCAMGFVECPAELAPTEFEFIPGDDNAGAPVAVAGPVDAAHTTAVVPNGEDEVPTIFTMTRRDANGVRLTTASGTFSASVTGANTTTPTIEELGNGQARGYYTPHNTGTDFVAISLEGTPISGSPYTSIVGTTPVVAPTAMPIGFWNNHPYSYGPTNLLAITSAPSSVGGTLGNAFSNGVKVALTFPRDLNKDSAGRFSVVRAKAAIDTYAGISAVSTAISNGTFDILIVLDDVAAQFWGGVTPSISDLSEVCAYAQSTFGSTVKTMIRKTATSLIGMTGLDYAGCQYLAVNGDWDGSGGGSGATAFRTNQETAASRIGCKIVFSLNLLNGGDGTSGILGTRAGHYAMSGTEIRTYGRVLMSSAMCKRFLMWRYDIDGNYANYFASTSVHSAISDLSAFASGEVRTA